MSLKSGEHNTQLKPLFKTNRLLARQLNPADAEHLYRLNSDKEVLKYTGDFPFQSVAEARQFLEGYKEYALHGCGRWALELKDGGMFIGWCGLKVHDENWVDLGFRLKKEFWNMGYATEAAWASLKFGFEIKGFDCIIARAAVANKASLRVLENLGMRFWKWGSFEGVPFAAFYRIYREDFTSGEKDSR